MPVMSVSQWATEVAKYGFDKINQDNALRNAVSKALDKAHNKDGFNFLNDRGDARKKYDLYIAKGNDINIAATMAAKCHAAKDDAKELKKLIDGEVKKEVERLFKTNIRQGIIDNASFKVWVESQNKPLIDKEAKKIAKDLQIKGLAELTDAINAEIYGNKAAAKKSAALIEKSEKKKDLYAALLKAMKVGKLI